MSSRYETLMAQLRGAQTLRSVADLLSWDQETMMPPRGARFRAEERSTVCRLAYERATDPRIGELLAECEADPNVTNDAVAAANLQQIRWDYDRALKLSGDLVAEITETGSLALEAWKQARARSDFAEFRPWLDKQLELARRKAACYGTPEGGEPYDALLEDYEPGMTGDRLTAIFGPLRAELTPLIEGLARGREPDPGPGGVELPQDRQRAFNRTVLGWIGFDLEAGRLDSSTHPFSIGLGPGDTRITTRYRDDGFLDALGSTLHEAGHGLYEQGLPKADRLGQPLAEPVSLGIHESQSRLWENHVGRSRAFWEWALGEVKRVFGSAVEPFSAEDFYRAVNIVRPNLIRVESDEATYNLHIMLRFDLERAMIRGDLLPMDLPGAWNERMKKDLGLDVPDDARGCLQDIHWSMGSFGYFPTYTLGNLYAAQLWEAVSDAVPDLQQRIARGKFDALLDWLRRNVHVHGRRFSAAELCRRVTGRPPDHRPLMRHLSGKFLGIYGIGKPPVPAG